MPSLFVNITISSHLKPTYPTSDFTTFAESAVYILHIFANNFGAKRDSLLQ